MTELNKSLEFENSSHNTPLSSSFNFKELETLKKEFLNFLASDLRMSLNEIIKLKETCDKRFLL